MTTLRYTREHEWLRTEDDGSVVVGITDYAQEQLGDIVYVELPETGSAVAAGAQLAVIESVKAVGEINMPVAGTVVEVNAALADTPELVNSEPLAGGWLLRLRCDDAAAIDTYMDDAAYQAFIADL